MWVRFFILYTITMTRYGQGLNFNKSLAIQDYQMIKPGLATLDLQLERDTLLRAAVEANVRWSIRQLLSLPEARRAIRAGKITLVGAVYELNTGEVRFLDD